MKRLILDETLVKKLTAVLRSGCPAARITVTPEAFTATYGTMRFTLHERQMTGELSPRTYQEEGPNFKGFILKVWVEKGPYQGQAMIPQELNGPYYPTFIDGPATADNAAHYAIRFSYGSRLDPQLKQAIFDALPRTRQPAR